MYKKALLLLVGGIFFVQTYAQQSKEVLFTIDESPVYISEFKRVYLKNIDLVKDDSQKDIDKYFDLFVNYKLKLKEASYLGLDKKEAYLSELEGYRKQLVKGYLTDNKASEAMVRQAYERSLEQVNASHILIAVKPNALAKDTVAAYQKIIEAKNKIDQGEPFDEVARAYSQDPSVLKNGGNLGWFSAFRMVYPFEEAAYTTQVGKVSEPFRTQFGYHIVKVNSKEKKLGEVTVAHIMVAANANRTAEQAKQRIEEINQQLEQGVSFSALAKQYSDDPSTAIKGGKLKRFGQGSLNSRKFEEVAFGLQDQNEISEPLQTQYGWHIIKLIEKHAPKSFEEQKAELVKKIKRDSRSKLITDSFINSLRKKYKLVKNEKAIEYFKKIIPETFTTQKWNIPEDDILQKELFAIKTKKYPYRDFAEFLKNNQTESRRYTDIPSYIEEMYQRFESYVLLQYYEKHLEEDNPDFANVIEEYRDGLLLFDLMESKIWNVSKTDSIGLRKFYEAKKGKYRQDETYKVLKASSSQHDVILKISELLKKQKTIDEIRKAVGETAENQVFFSEENLIKGKHNLPKDFSEEIGRIDISKDENFTTLIMLKEILPSRIKTFEETKGEVINDYQQNMEKKWLDQLREKYSVKINKKTLKKAKKELSI